mgnify:FL=1
MQPLTWIPRPSGPPPTQGHGRAPQRRRRETHGRPRASRNRGLCLRRATSETEPPTTCGRTKNGVDFLTARATRRITYIRHRHRTKTEGGRGAPIFMGLSPAEPDPATRSDAREWYLHNFSGAHGRSDLATMANPVTDVLHVPSVPCARHGLTPTPLVVKGPRRLPIHAPKVVVPQTHSSDGVTRLRQERGCDEQEEQRRAR